MSSISTDIPLGYQSKQNLYIFQLKKVRSFFHDYPYQQFFPIIIFKLNPSIFSIHYIYVNGLLSIDQLMNAINFYYYFLKDNLNIYHILFILVLLEISTSFQLIYQRNTGC